MFFSPDLLSKRDSGFGLLWLAATLGSKSAFKKLPKRSVMTADISQLCRLIATPVEPLALRLSSNLLVGAARVYRVKQEIFISDVTTCFNSLKRVEHEFRSMTSSDGQLQMAQPSVKSSVVTLRADPKAAFFTEFDAMVTDWDEYLNLGTNKHVEDDSDNDYHPTTTKGKGKGKGKGKTSSTLPPNLELHRATACTLPENHEFLLATSFDASFGESGMTKISSSQIGGFGFDDTFDGLDIGEGVGDDLVRELGEGWGPSQIQESPPENLAQIQEPFGMDLQTVDLDDGIGELDAPIQVAHEPRPLLLTGSVQNSLVEAVESPVSLSFTGTTKSTEVQTTANGSRTPPVGPAAQDACGEPIQPENNGATFRKAKRTRPMVDVRTELTDEELKATRMYYLDKQNTIRCELELKRFDKKQDCLAHSLLWDVPDSVHAKELADFWVSHFKAHVEARSGLPAEPRHLDGGPRQKRRKLSTPHKAHTGGIKDVPMLDVEDWHANKEVAMPVECGNVVGFDHNVNVDWGVIDDTPDAKNLRSSEEPGQARRASQPPLVFADDLGADVVSDTFHSQRSALFPWDMAGGSSSVSAREGMQVPANDRISVEHADARLRGSSASRRGSSLPSVSNLQTGAGSPAVILPMIPSDDDFVFDVPGDNHAIDSRQSEANRVALEKNSYNFLEYARMQYRSLPSSQYLLFDDIVPKATSTARVAAAALYHCLVLATKDLLQVNQGEPYGRIDIRIK